MSEPSTTLRYPGKSAVVAMAALEDFLASGPRDAARYIVDLARFQVGELTFDVTQIHRFVGAARDIIADDLCVNE